MGKALADVLPFAFGLLAAPFPIVAVILLVMGDGGRAKPYVFLGTWLVTVFVIALVVALVTGSRGAAGADGASPVWVHGAQIVLGVVMVLVALRTLRTHSARAPDASPSPPAWLTAIGRLGAGTGWSAPVRGWWRTTKP